MSKKSRRRNKKLLMLAALAGGAALAGRGKGIGTKETISDAQKGHNFGSSAPVTGVTNPNEAIAKAKEAAAASSGKSYLSRMQGGDPDDPTGHIAQKRRGLNAQIMQAKANAPKGIYPPGSVPMQRTGLGPRRFSKGGKVTGIAKRGFGRALEKGKK